MMESFESMSVHAYFGSNSSTTYGQGKMSDVFGNLTNWAEESKKVLFIG